MNYVVQMENTGIWKQKKMKVRFISAEMVEAQPLLRTLKMILIKEFPKKRKKVQGALSV